MSDPKITITDNIHLHDGPTTDTATMFADTIVRIMLSSLNKLDLQVPEMITALGEATAVLNVLFAPTKELAIDNAKNFGDSMASFAENYWKDRDEMMAEHGIARKEPH